MTAITYKQLREDASIRTYIIRADESLLALGFTEHSFAHVTMVSENAAHILETLGYSEHEVELVRIAGYLHDIGNLINRVDHSQSGALLAFSAFGGARNSAEDISLIVTAIGNHDEGTGVPVNAVAAALILADKCDVRRSRVRNRNISTFDIHDRVNYSVTESNIRIDDSKATLSLNLTMTRSIAPLWIIRNIHDPHEALYACREQTRAELCVVYQRTKAALNRHGRVVF